MPPRIEKNAPPSNEMMETEASALMTREYIEKRLHSPVPYKILESILGEKTGRSVAQNIHTPVFKLGALGMSIGVLGPMLRASQALDPERKNRFSEIFQNWVIKQAWANQVLWWSGCKREVEGRGNIPKQGPNLIVYNHQGWMENLIGHAEVPAETRYVIKEDVARMPVMGPAMVRHGAVVLSRKDTQKDILALSEGARNMREKGWNYSGYPEGTRGKDDRVLGFGKGLFKMAIEGKARTVVPVALSGSGIFMRDLSLTKPINPTILRIGFCEPIPVEGKTSEELVVLSRSAILEVLKKWGDLGGDPNKHFFDKNEDWKQSLTYDK